MTTAAVNAPIVQQAYDIFNNKLDGTTEDVKKFATDQMARIIGVIENHTSTCPAKKEILMTTALLYKAGISMNSETEANAIDITFGRKVGDNLRGFYTSITDEKNYADAAAVTMAISCANMEGTLAKLSNPATYEQGLKESGGKEHFANYACSTAEERAMLMTAYSSTPALLKYEMRLMGIVSDALSGKTPAVQSALALAVQY